MKAVESNIDWFSINLEEFELALQEYKDALEECNRVEREIKSCSKQASAVTLGN